MTEISSFTQFLMKWSNLFFMVLVPALVLAWIVLVFFLVRRAAVRNEPAVWLALKVPVIIAVMPLLACWYVWMKSLFSIDASIMTAVLETGIIVLISCALLGALLWYKGLLTAQRVGRFALWNIVGGICFVALVLGSVKGYEFLLLRDQGFREMLAMIEKMALEQMQQQNQPVQ